MTSPVSPRRSSRKEDVGETDSAQPSTPQQEDTITVSKKELAEMFAAQRREILAELAPKDDVPLPEVEEDDPDVVIIHMVRDGLTALGRIWYRGQEIKLKRGSKEWEEEGRHFMELTAREQREKLGDHFHAPGRWPHGEYDPDVVDAELAAAPLLRGERSSLTTAERAILLRENGKRRR